MKYQKTYWQLALVLFGVSLDVWSQCDTSLSPKDNSSKFIEAIECLNGEINRLNNVIAGAPKATAPNISLSKERIFEAFPKGTILAWYSKSGVVPKGWAVCDGSNGTPDLRGRFLMGVSNFSDVGQKGGSNTASISIPSHKHDIAKGSKQDALRAENGGGVMSHTTVVDYLYNTYTVESGATSLNISALPPYETVLYIMKNDI